MKNKDMGKGESAKQMQKWKSYDESLGGWLSLSAWNHQRTNKAPLPLSTAAVRAGSIEGKAKAP